MQIDVATEAVTSPGPLSLINAAQDELDRRYGLDDTDKGRLHLEEMTPPLGVFVVARVAGHLAGGVAVRSILDPAQGIGEIKRLWVRPDLRSSGVATRLMELAEIEARTLKMTTLYLETGVRQPEAHAFYLKQGWLRVEQFPDGAFSYPLGLKFMKEL